MDTQPGQGAATSRRVSLLPSNAQHAAGGRDPTAGARGSRMRGPDGPPTSSSARCSSAVCWLEARAAARASAAAAASCMGPKAARGRPAAASGSARNRPCMAAPQCGPPPGQLTPTRGCASPPAPCHTARQAPAPKAPARRHAAAGATFSFTSLGSRQPLPPRPPPPATNNTTTNNKNTHTHAHTEQPPATPHPTYTGSQPPPQQHRDATRLTPRQPTTPPAPGASHPPASCCLPAAASPPAGSAPAPAPGRPPAAPPAPQTATGWPVVVGAGDAVHVTVDERGASRSCTNVPIMRMVRAGGLGDGAVCGAGWEGAPRRKGGAL